MADTPKSPANDDKAMFGEHASGRYGDQAFGRIEPRPDAGKPDSGTNAQIVGGAPASSTKGDEDERDSPGISTDKKSDDTKPASGA